MNEAQRDVALFRYSLIREAADASLSTRQRGQLVRQLAGADHAGPHSRRVRVARGTIDRWVRAYRAGGFEALAPVPRSGEPVTEKRLLDLAEALKREVPRRTAAQVAEIIRTTEGAGPAARTLQRHFARLGLNTRPDGSAPQAFGRFEAAAPGDLWTGDALHGPVIAGRKTYLFAFIDDHSRALVGYRWGLSEDTVRLEAAFRCCPGGPGCAPGCSTWTTAQPMSPNSCCGRAPASGSVSCTPSPGRPQGRGKIERFFETVRAQFLVEVEARPPADLAELNRLFSAWVETVYHRRAHSETGEAPIDRLLAGGRPGAAQPRGAARSVLVVRGPHGDQDGHGLPARQHF